MSVVETGVGYGRRSERERSVSAHERLHSIKFGKRDDATSNGNISFREPLHTTRNWSKQHKKEQGGSVPMYSGTKLYLTICSCNFFICGIKRIAYIVLTREKRWKREDDDLSIQKMQVQQWNVIMFFLSGMWSDCLQTASLHIFRQDFLFYSSNGIL